MITNADIDRLFEYQTPTADQAERLALVNAAAKVFYTTIAAVCPSSADTSAAYRKVIEAKQTANQSIILNREPLAVDTTAAENVAIHAFVSLMLKQNRTGSINDDRNISPNEDNQ